MNLIKRIFTTYFFLLPLLFITVSAENIFAQDNKPAVEDSFEIATFKTPQDEAAEKLRSQKSADILQKEKKNDKESTKSASAKKTLTQPSMDAAPIESSADGNLSEPPPSTPRKAQDYVFAFEGSDASGGAGDDSFDEEYSLSVDGGLVPASKLFSELLDEANAAQRKLAEQLQAQADQAAAVQAESQPVLTQNNQGAVSYVKKTTLVTTTTSYATPMLALANSMSVNARVLTTDAAWKLVRLAAMGDGAALPVEWAQHMVDAGRAYNVDPILLLEVCRQESRFRNSARSPKEAQGLMQFIPGTAQRFGINPYDPRQAIHGGGRYIRVLLDMFRGEVRSALAGYNAGEGAVIAFATGRTIYQRSGKVINSRGSRTLFGIPPYAETQNYVVTIYNNYLRSRERLARF